MKTFNKFFFRLLLAVSILLPMSSKLNHPDFASAQSLGGGTRTNVFIPFTQTVDNGLNWPQLAHDPQRTGATPLQVDPPYCYAWKWNAVAVASRAQPVVMNGIFLVGGMDGRLYARSAITGQALWNYATGGPIRHSAAATPSTVITGSYDGYTYALAISNGALIWKTFTGSSATAPLIDERNQRIYVASTYGKLTALSLSKGAKIWEYDARAAILTSPAMSSDGTTIFFGSEAVAAIAVDAATGAQRWKTTLQGQSLAERFPVVVGNSVIYRSQPYYFFHNMLQTWGDDVMDQAGALNADWAADWNNVKPKIINYLNSDPSKQTMFVLNASSGASQGTLPVLYTYGSNDIANVPVFANNNVYLTYRARHGIQTDYPTVHVTSKYDAELGKLNLSTLDISGLTVPSKSALSIPLTGGPGFRMTSDEAGMLTMGGNILWVDNWERLGGLNVNTGQVVHAGNVSNNWPECGSQCGPAGPRPFFPLSGNPADPAYPFPSPRVTEGHARSGAVIANHMVYWHTIEAGMAAISHSTAASCPAPVVWSDTGGDLFPAYDIPTPPAQPAATLQSYVTNDLTTPATISIQNQDLVNRLNFEVTAMLAAAQNGHLMPYYLERGFSNTTAWPYNSSKPGIPGLGYLSHGNLFWQDPGELLLTMAQAYPYLTPSLQTQVASYMQAEMGRYSPLQDLPYNTANRDWLRTGSPREPYPIVIRSSLNNWPPVAANISAIYSLWLWSKNTNDWTYAQAHWAEIQSLFNARSSSMLYYADIAGAIGYYRLAAHFNNAAEATKGMNAAVAGMQAGLNFATFRDRAKTDYPDPRGETTGWSAPLFFGITPEVGLYLREQFNGAAVNHLIGLESLNSNGIGMIWWYVTRAGEHAENGETSFLLPNTAWSHFLGHAYIVGDHQPTLRKWLDRPWVAGDLYSLQKITATLQSPP